MSTSSRRDDLHTVYAFVVDNFAVYAIDIETHTSIPRDKARSLLASLERKGLVVSEHVNSEREVVWQSYHDAMNEDGAKEQSEVDFAAAFPEGSVKDTQTPTQVEKHRPNEGEVIYEVKRTRSTGARVTLTNYSTGTGKRRYVATCHLHSTEHAFDKRLPGEAQCHHPEVWCDGCHSQGEQR